MASMLLSKNQRLADHQSSPSLHVTCVTWWPNINISIKYRFLGVPSKQRRPNVHDVGPTLYECYTHVLCLRGMHTDGVRKILAAFVVLFFAQ